MCCCQRMQHMLNVVLQCLGITNTVAVVAGKCNTQTACQCFERRHTLIMAGLTPSCSSRYSRSCSSGQPYSGSCSGSRFWMGIMPYG